MTDKMLRVLLADDSEDDRILLAKALQTVPGFELIGLTINGADTIAWINATLPYCDHKAYPLPDLLLLDYQMPGYSGLDVLECLREHRRRPTIILWSHAAELISSSKAYALGATLVCEKPDNPSALAAILARIYPHHFIAAESTRWVTNETHDVSG